MQTPRRRYESHIARVANILKRITVDNKEIRNLSLVDRSIIAIDAKGSRAVDGPYTNCIGSRDPGSDKRIQLAMRSEPWQMISIAHMIGNQRDRAARFMERCDRRNLGVINGDELLVCLLLFTPLHIGLHIGRK